MRKILFIIFTLIIIPFAAATADASGLGFYVGGGSGDSDIDTGPNWWSITNSNKSDVELGSAGLVFDTNLSEDRVFNYRLELGRGNYTLKDFPKGVESEIGQTVMTHDFGFGIMRTKAVRLWLGPEIRLTKINDEVNGVDYDMRGFGFGLAIGLNINVLDPVTFALKASFLNQTLNGDIYNGSVTEDISIDDDITMVTAAVIFRFGEKF